MQNACVEGEKVSYELKYCERCGGLWLRPMGGGEIYCTSCARAMEELPLPLREPEPDSELEQLWRRVVRVFDAGEGDLDFDELDVEEDEDDGTDWENPDSESPGSETSGSKTSGSENPDSKTSGSKISGGVK